MEKLIKKTDFADLVNVSPAAITKACNNKLKPAMSGTRIDLNHPLVIDYIEKKRLQQERKNAQNPNSEKLKKVNQPSEVYEFVKVEPIKHSKSQKAMDENSNDKSNFYTNQGREVPENIRRYLKYTVEDVINEFGTETALNDFLLSVKRIEDIHEKRIKNAKTSGELISRHLVKIGMLDPIASSHTKLLLDGSKTIAKRVIAKYDAGSTIQELEKFVSEQIGSFFKPMKQKIKRTLASLDDK